MDENAEKEVTLALMASDISYTKTEVKKLVVLIQGNGEDGLKGKVRSALVQLKIQWLLLFFVAVFIVRKLFV